MTTTRLRERPIRKMEGVTDASRLWKAMKAGQVRVAILKLLKERDMHGYEMMEEIRSRTGGFFSPSAGTIYPILRDLLKNGHVHAEWASSGGRRKKKVYRITEKGSATLAAFEQIVQDAGRSMRDSLSKASKLLEIDRGEAVRFGHVPGIPGFGGGLLYKLVSGASESESRNQKLKRLREAQRFVRTRIRILRRGEKAISKRIESLQRAER